MDDNRIWKDIVLYNYIDNDFSQHASISRDFDCFIIINFGKLINNNKNQVIGLAFQMSRNRQSYDKIYR